MNFCLTEKRMDQYLSVSVFLQFELPLDFLCLKRGNEIPMEMAHLKTYCESSIPA